MTDVYDTHDGRPFWASVGVFFTGSVMLALSLGISFGQFVQITRYAEAGIVPFALETYTAAFGVDAVLALVFACVLIWVSATRRRAIDTALQPWLEVVCADEWGDPAMSDDYMFFMRSMLGVCIPLLVVVTPLAWFSPRGASIVPVLNTLFWVAVAVSGWYLWRRLRGRPPVTAARGGEQP